jgi:hypothetical protein
MAKDRSEDRHATPRRVFSVSDDLWDEFGEAVGERQRSEYLRLLIAAFLGRPGAKMPKRPKVPDAKPTPGA